MATPHEIWSVRLQRELLALTNPPSTEAEGEENADSEKANVGILPPFLSVKDHQLDIPKGICRVYFNIEIDEVKSVPNKEEEVTEPKLNVSIEDSPDKDDDEEEEPQETESVTTPNEPVVVTIMLDVSLLQPSTESKSCYPFSRPHAILFSDDAPFQKLNIPLQTGQAIYIDCDWTPSLHLNDAALHVALELRESLKRGEACFKSPPPETTEPTEEEEETGNFASKANRLFTNLKSRASAMAEELDKAMEDTKPKLRTPLRRKGRGGRREQVEEEVVEPKIVTPSNIEIGDEIDLSQEPWCFAVGMYPCKAIRRPEFIEEAIAEATAKEEATRKVSKWFGDEDEDAPMVPYSAGNYMQLQAGSIFEVGNAGLAGAGNMFKSFTQSAKTLVQESFLMLTEDLIIEIKCNKFSVANATITIAIPVSHLAKLKFRREESLSLFFKQAPQDPIIYMCESSADAVKQVQNVLQRHGIKGKHNNSATQRAVQTALQTLEDIRIMEEALEKDPSPERVTAISDMYRQVAEKFEYAGDARHKEALANMHVFLAKPLVASILDGTYEKKELKDNKEVKEIVEESSETHVTEIKSKSEKQIDNPIKTTVQSTTAVDEADDFEKAMQDAEDMLKDAHNGLDDLNIDDLESEEYDSALLTGTTQGGSGDDVVSEFEDMLKDADKELAELMDF